MQRDAVQGRGHAEFAHAPVDVAPGRIRAHRAAARPVGEVGVGEVGRAAEQLGQRARQAADGLLAGLAGGELGGLLVHAAQDGVGQYREAHRQRAGHAAAKLLGLFREGLGVGVEPGTPFVVLRRAAGARVEGGADLAGDLEGQVWPVECAARGGDLAGTEGGAVHIGRARAPGAAMADVGAAADQRRAGVGLGVAQGHLDGAIDGGDVVAVHRLDHVPAIGAEACRRVVGEPAGDVAVDRDAVVVPEAHQLRQPLHAGEARGFVADAFHQAAVAEEDPGAVIDEGVAGAVELGSEQLLGERHAHGVGQALAQRAGGGLDAGRVADLGVAGGAAVELAEAFELVERQLVAAEVEQGVEQHRAVAVGEHEAVTVGPGRVRRVVLQVPRP